VRRTGSRTTTLRDVARLADVHVSTASRALNGHTLALVHPDTAERVRAVAEYLGYQPNELARGLKTSRSQTVGVLVPDLLNPVVPPIVRGIAARLRAAGYTVLLGNADHSGELERLYVDVMRGRQVDGLIAGTAYEGDEALLAVAKTGLPVVLFNRSATDGSISAAVPDDLRTAELAVGHLAELGHRRIAHVAGPATTSTGARRREGFEAALARHAVDPDPRLVAVATRYSAEEGARCCHELLLRGLDFTAVVAANDLLALGCYDALAEAGLRCPADVSVVGCNDMPFTERFDPPLTTVNISHDRLGAAAAELLLELFDEPNLPPREVVIEPALVVRKSTAPPARGASEPSEQT
jgi:LacI family transcriptional regulator